MAKRRWEHEVPQNTPENIPSDEAVRRAATLALVEDVLETARRQHRKGHTLQLGQPSVFTDDYTDDYTPEVALVRLLMAEGDRSLWLLAETLGVSSVAVRDALAELSCGARVEWHAGKAVA